MVLPSGVNKGSGLKAALRDRGLSPHEVVGVGNAENDQSFLEICECAVAVGNAIEAIKTKVDFSTRSQNGADVVELIEELLYCDTCRERHLVGSCRKGRGFYRSCLGRRMIEGAANLVDHVLPEVRSDSGC